MTIFKQSIWQGLRINFFKRPTKKRQGWCEVLSNNDDFFVDLDSALQADSDYACESKVSSESGVFVFYE